MGLDGRMKKKLRSRGWLMQVHACLMRVLLTWLAVSFSLALLGCGAYYYNVNFCGLDMCVREWMVWMHMKFGLPKFEPDPMPRSKDTSIWIFATRIYWTEPHIRLTFAVLTYPSILGEKSHSKDLEIRGKRAARLLVLTYPCIIGEKSQIAISKLGGSVQRTGW